MFSDPPLRAIVDTLAAKPWSDGIGNLPDGAQCHAHSVIPVRSIAMISMAMAGEDGRIAASGKEE